MSDLLASIRAKRQTIADKKTGSKNFYKFKPGTTRIRILPSWRFADATADQAFYHDFGQAYIKDLDNNLLAVIGDRSMTYGEDDAVRNLIQLAKAEAPTDAQREHWHGLLAKQGHIVNAAVLSDSTINPEEPELVNFSQSQLDAILGQMEKLLLAGDNPLDLAEGFDLEVDRVGTTVKDTRYTFSFARRPSAISPKIMERVIDLDSFVRSKFADTDRAINAIKSISQGALLPAPERSTSYTNGDTAKDTIRDAEYTVVDEAKEGVKAPISTNSREVSDDELDRLLGEI